MKKSEKNVCKKTSQFIESDFVIVWLFIHFFYRFKRGAVKRLNIASLHRFDG